MTRELFEITDTDTASVFIKLAMYRSFKDTEDVSFCKSRETLDKIRDKISRGRSQYKTFLLE